METLRSSVNKPHAVIVSIPAHSHVYPVLQLGFNLISSGFVVTFASPERIHSHMVKLGTDRFGQRSRANGDFRIVLIPDGLPVYAKNDRPSAARFGEAILKIEAALEQLMEKLSKENPPVSCIIANTFLVGALDIANKFGVPKVDFFPSSATAFAIDMYLTLLISNGYSPEEDDDTKEAVITCIPGLPSLRKSDIAQEFWVNDLSDTMFQILFRPFERIRQSECILVNTFYELESQAIDALKTDNIPLYSVGPLLPSTNVSGISKDQMTQLSEADECLSWLSKHGRSSVVYVSFGSFVSLSTPEIHELALGLEASEQPFLWVIHHNSKGVSLSDVLPEGFKSRTNEQGLLVNWAPQIHVLSHPSVGAFLSHCGWNSTLESLSMGVPIIGWPVEQEQNTNLKLIVDEWGAGVALGRKQDGVAMCKKKVEAAVRDVMQGQKGKELRERAKKLSYAARNAASDGGTSKRNFEEFVEVIKKKA